jgi:lipopolysaccharide transport system permease protein
VISPPLALRGLWMYRGFILGSVKREFQAKYANAILGTAWSLLQPLAMIVVYTVIFTEVMRSKLPGAESCPAPTPPSPTASTCAAAS